ncbi:hypothetical protein HK101_006359 [Irineochytrium annulatum]|nr:hypothetical protein HK101_006359 [Irineochytrium annulatum]
MEPGGSRSTQVEAVDQQKITKRMMADEVPPRTVDPIADVGLRQEGFSYAAGRDQNTQSMSRPNSFVGPPATLLEDVDEARGGEEDWDGASHPTPNHTIISSSSSSNSSARPSATITAAGGKNAGSEGKPSPLARPMGRRPASYAGTPQSMAENNGIPSATDVGKLLRSATTKENSSMQLLNGGAGTPPYIASPSESPRSQRQQVMQQVLTSARTRQVRETRHSGSPRTSMVIDLKGVNKNFTASPNSSNMSVLSANSSPSPMGSPPIMQNRSRLPPGSPRLESLQPLAPLDQPSPVSMGGSRGASGRLLGPEHQIAATALMVEHAESGVPLAYSRLNNSTNVAIAATDSIHVGGEQHKSMMQIPRSKKDSDAPNMLSAISAPMLPMTGRATPSGNSPNVSSSQLYQDTAQMQPASSPPPVPVYVGRDLPFNQWNGPSNARRLSISPRQKADPVTASQASMPVEHGDGLMDASLLNRKTPRKFTMRRESAPKTGVGIMAAAGVSAKDLENQGSPASAAGDRYSSIAAADGSRKFLRSASALHQLPDNTVESPPQSRCSKHSTAANLPSELNGELKGITCPQTLTFKDNEVEESYRVFFVQTYTPLWRIGLYLELCIGAMIYLYHMIVYPHEAQLYRQIASLQTNLGEPIVCPAGYWCEVCPTDSLCSDFSYVKETIFFLAGLVVPNLLLLLMSYRLISSPRFANCTHLITCAHMLSVCAIQISVRHFVMEPRTSPYLTLLFYIITLFGCATILRIRFLYVVAISPLVIGIYAAEASAATYTYGYNTWDSVIITCLLVVGTMAVICLQAYDSERSTRSQFLRSHSYMKTTVRLMDQLKEINMNYSDHIADFDSPLEKAIAMLNTIRTEPGVMKDYTDKLGVILALLNSSDLMSPDIERQVEGGKVLLDEEGEAWLLSNLYRGRARGNSKTNALRRKSTVVFMERAMSGEIHQSVQGSIVSPSLMMRGVSFSESNAVDSHTSNASLSTAMSRKRSMMGSDDDSSRRKESLAIPGGQNRKESIASVAVSDIHQHLFQQHPNPKFFVSDTNDPGSVYPISFSVVSSPPPVTQNASVANANVSDPNATAAQLKIAQQHAQLSANHNTDYFAHSASSILPAIMSEGSLENSGSQYRSLSMDAVADIASKKQLSTAAQAARVVTTGDASDGGKLYDRSGRRVEGIRESPTGSEEWDSVTDITARLQMVSLLEKVDHWNWELFELAAASNQRPLFALSHYLFLRADLYNKFQLSTEVFLTFMTRIESGYRRDVPYHNALHATDVLHGVAWLRHRCLDMVAPSDLETLALYLSAIIHDFDHPGRNNNFLINTSDAKAMLYNDRSVLENHHISSAFRILVSPECHFLANLPKDDYKQIRELVIDLVLATDLQTQHFSIMSMFKNKVSLTNKFDPREDLEDRTLLYKMMLKCADVSNPTKSWHLYEKWTARVLEEFFLQGDAEKSYGIPVSPYYDRETIVVPASQLGFIDFICVPLYEAFDLFAPVPCALEGTTTT